MLQGLTIRTAFGAASLAFAIVASTGAARASAPNSISYTFQTVDDPASTSNFNRVTSIDDAGEIVGNYGDTSTCPSSDPLSSFSSQPGYTSFTPLNFPNANGTYAASIPPSGGLNSQLIVGYACGVKSLNKNTVWGFIDYQNNWSLIKKPSNEGSGVCAVNQILGINDSQYSVGFFLDSNCNGHAIEITPGEVIKKLYPPNASSAEATGIDDNGDIVGFETTSSGIQGWYFDASTNQYSTYSFPGAIATESYGTNSQGYVVGTYENTSKKWRGFLLVNPTAPPSQQIWQDIPEPKSVGVTVISGINDLDDICGWYEGAQIYHGFVAMPPGGILWHRATRWTAPRVPGAASPNATKGD